MRLRKNMKRAAAAALALSMAVSAATPAMAGYKIDMSKVNGDVTITKGEDGTVTVSGSTTGITKTDDKNDNNITITGDNTVHEDDAATTAAENGTAVTQEAPEADTTEETAPAEDAEDETTEDTTGGVATMDLTEEDYAPAAEDEDTAEDAPKAEEPARTVEETEEGTVITYDDYDVDPDMQVTKPAAKAEKSTSKAEKDDDEAVTYEGKATNSITKAFSDTVRNVIKIINNSKEELKITLDNLTVDAGSRAEDAMNISGTGDVTLELDGDNTLTGGNAVAENPYNDMEMRAHSGLYSDPINQEQTAYMDNTITIKDDDRNGTLTAKGGDVKENTVTDENHVISGGYGINTPNLVLNGANVTAVGGNVEKGNNTKYSMGGGTGVVGSTATITDSTLVARGGNAEGTNCTVSGGIGMAFQGVTEDQIARGTKITNSHISATGGNGTSQTGFGAGALAAGFVNGHLEMTNVNFYAKGGDGYSKSGTASGATGLAQMVQSAKYSGNFMTLGGNATTETGSAVQVVYGYQRFVFYPQLDDAPDEFSSGNWVAAAGCATAPTGTTKYIYPPVVLQKDGDNYQPMKIGKDANFNLYGTDGTEFTLPDDFADETTGTITYYKNASVSTDGNGTGNVTGEVFKREVDGTADSLDNAPTEATLDALKHEWEVSEDGTYKECTICHLREEIPQPEPDPVAPDENGSDSTTALELWVTDADGLNSPFTVTQNGTVRTYTANADVATLNGNMEILKYLKEHGAQTIVFATNQQTSQFNIDDVLAQSTGNESFYLAHNGAEEAQVVVIG